MDKRFIEQCEQEELHYSGAIQPHGVLIVLGADHRIRHYSANHADFLPEGMSLAVDQPIPEELHRLVSELPLEVGTRRQYEAAVTGRNGQLDMVLSRNAVSEIIVELSDSLPSDFTVRPWFVGIEPPESRGEMHASQQALIEKVFELTGYDRVMYYRFRDDGDGEVLAEVRQQDVTGSYLGLRFPASDIPQIARLLYLMNPWRLIPDVSAKPVPVLGKAGDVPDLTYSDLRSVSPIHLLYLENMGVKASLSFPIVVAGQLWGLIACHHSVPRQVALAALSAIAQEVRAHSLSLTAYFAQRRMQLVDGMMRRFNAARHMVHDAGDIVTAWPQLGEWLAGEFGADGADLCIGNERISWGEGLEPEALKHVDAWFCDQRIEPVWLSERLSRQVPAYPLSRVAGLLAVKARTGRGEHLRVYLGRHEHIHEISWGGNPDKPVEHHDGKFGIAPRRSFEKWVEKRMGRSRPWDNETRLLGLKLREILLQMGRDG